MKNTGPTGWRPEVHPKEVSHEKDLEGKPGNFIYRMNTNNN